MAEGHTPTDSMASNARRGLALRKEYGRGGTAVGVARARDIANKAWTEWSVNPTVGYGLSDDFMIGCTVSQMDSTEDVSVDLHARYFFNDYFAYVATEGLDTESLKLGVGKMFSFHKNGMFIDPKVVYDTAAKTTNLQLGFGLKF